MLVVGEPVAGPDHVAAVERPDAQAGQRAHHLGAQLLEPVVLHQHPEEVLVGEPLPARLVGKALGRQRLVDMRAVGAVGVQALLTFRLGPLTGGADVHHRQPGLLGEREGAGVQGVGQLLVVLGDHAGAAAVGAVEGHQLEAQPVGDKRHRAVQLGSEPP